MVTECTRVVSEQGHTDPYTLPPHLIALEGTIHLFQLHFSTESTKENPVYILDTVMETGPQLLVAPQENVPANRRLIFRPIYLYKHFYIGVMNRGEERLQLESELDRLVGQVQPSLLGLC